jgi:hypothetical protein
MCVCHYIAGGVAAIAVGTPSVFGMRALLRWRIARVVAREVEAKRAADERRYEVERGAHR